MKLRIGPELQRHLSVVKASGISAAEAVRRAARRWERLGRPSLAEFDPGTTYGGTVVTVEPPGGMDAETIRRLLAWYFENWPARLPRYRFDPGKLTEGRDYIIVAE